MATEYPDGEAGTHGEAGGDWPDTGPPGADEAPPVSAADPDAGVDAGAGEDPEDRPTGDETGRDATAVEAAATAMDGSATDSIKRILEAALFVAGRPLAITDFEKLFGGSAEAPPRNAIRSALAELEEDWAGRSLALQEVATGWRAQVRTEYEPWIARLWDEKPPRYSRALLETLAIIAYRQPMTRSEIEDIRGVSVSSQIIRTLSEREWIRVVGHREAPGRPAMYGTTREFLDYFNLKTLDQLPPISDIKDLEGQYPELGFEAEPASRANGPGVAAASPESHQESQDENAVDATATGAGEPAGAPADAGDTNGETGNADDAPGDRPDATADGAPPPATGDGVDDDDAEESPCTPAS